MTDQELVSALRRLLGASLVAYIGAADSTSAVEAWASGSQPLGTAVRDRLRIAFAAAESIGRRDDATTIQSWFQGLNELLDDRAPARLLRDDTPGMADRVLRAADAFAAGH